MNTSTLSFLDVIRQVQCQTCGKVAEYTQCELIDRLDKDWPRCCGRNCCTPSVRWVMRR